MKAISINQNLIILGVPLSLLGVLILLMKSSVFVGNDTLSLAITADLLITIPLIYFLLIRKTEIPKTTIVPLMIIGLLIGSYFLPKEDQVYLDLFKTWFLPVIELSILVYVIINVRKVTNKYKRLNGSTSDFYTALRSTCLELLPKKLAVPFATEVAVIYYGFINWRRRVLKKGEFSYHKKSGTPALLGIFIFLIGIETFALHLVLEKWNVYVAWVFSGLSIYTAIQILGFAKSLSKRPISLDCSDLILRYGIMNEARIPYGDIESVHLSRKALEKNDLTTTLSPLGGFESHNVVIRLKREYTLMGFYGIKKNFKVIGLHIDEPKSFKEKVENICTNRMQE